MADLIRIWPPCTGQERDCRHDDHGKSNRLSITAFPVAGAVLPARCAANRLEMLLRALAVRCRTTRRHDLVLRLNRRFELLSRCGFFNALHVRIKRRALLVFFLWTLGGDAR